MKTVKNRNPLVRYTRRLSGKGRHQPKLDRYKGHSVVKKQLDKEEKV